MTLIRTCVTLLLALTLSLATSAAAQPLSGPEFIPLATPCRALDTRVTGTPVPANVPTTIQVTGVTNGPGGDCGVPPTAVGAALNFTITEPQGPGWMTAWPSGPLPLASVVNWVTGETVANAVDVALAPDGTILVQPVAVTHLVIDVYGYFTDVEVLAGANTAIGALALQNNTTGVNNTATGFATLQNNTTGSSNTATGAFALFGNNGNITGVNNTAMGEGALFFNTTGSNNTAMGINAGLNVTTGSHNIHIGNIGSAADSALIRIGTVGIHASTFIAGIFGATVLAGTQVEVNSNGQLGTVISSRRVKDNIRDMEEASGGLVKLRPVTFRYKAEHANGPRQLEYGLIAEEVAEIYPELVVRDTDGQPAGVRYHVLPAMLLNELQRQQREIDELRAQVRALIKERAGIVERRVGPERQ